MVQYPTVKVQNFTIPQRNCSSFKAKAQVLEINTIIDVVTYIISNPCISEMLEPP